MSRAKDPAKVKQGRRNRTSGKVWERKVATDMREIFGDGVRRGWQSRRGDDEADNEGVPRMWLEAKHGAGASGVRKALAQAAAAAVHTRRRPVAICKDKRQKGKHWEDKRKAVVFVAMYREGWQDLLGWVLAAWDASGVSDPHWLCFHHQIAKKDRRVNVPQAYVKLMASGLTPLGPPEADVVTMEVDDGSAPPFVVLDYEMFKLCCRTWMDALELHVLRGLERLR